MRPRHEVAEVIRSSGEALLGQHPQSAHVMRTLSALARCRTAALGGHVSRCKSCSRIHPHYNSCRNRHCPKCQNTERERWVLLRAAEMQHLGGCFHVVFTLPAEFNPLCIRHPKQMYDALFRAAADTIAAMGRNPKLLGAEPGMVAILHTWGQQLSLHPHLHCLIPAGGITIRGNWKPLKGKGKYLFPQKAMAAVFRAKYMAEVTARLQKQGITIAQDLRKAVMQKPWVVYAKAPLSGPGQIIEYLGRYSHKIAISNHRIQSIENGQITFAYKDYRQAGTRKEMTLTQVEFLRRFCLHILPSSYRRIRHFGFLATRKRAPVMEMQKMELLIIKRMDWKELCRRYLGFDPDKCPRCGKSNQEIIQTILPERGPPLFGPSRPKPLKPNESFA
jgi:hypothetical protein